MKSKVLHCKARVTGPRGAVFWARLLSLHPPIAGVRQAVAYLQIRRRKRSFDMRDGITRTHPYYRISPDSLRVMWVMLSVQRSST